MKSAMKIIVLALSFIITTPAVAKPEPSCRIIRAEGASYLEQCGNQLRSFSLSLADITKKASRDIHGRFSFYCPIPEICANDPTIGGYFFSPVNWNNSRKDERAIFETIQGIPLGAAVWSRQGGPLQESPPAVCPVFEVLIGDVGGRAICYGMPKSKGASIVVVASDEHIGIILSFYRNDQGMKELREKVLTIVPRFKVERGIGDAALMRWLK